MGFASQTHFQKHILSIKQKHAVLLHLKNNSLSNFPFTWISSEQQKLEQEYTFRITGLLDFVHSLVSYKNITEHNVLETGSVSAPR
jgi:tRNA splicing ligase